MKITLTITDRFRHGLLARRATLQVALRPSRRGMPQWDDE